MRELKKIKLVEESCEKKLKRIDSIDLFCLCVLLLVKLLAVLLMQQDSLQ